MKQILCTTLLLLYSFGWGGTLQATQIPLPEAAESQRDAAMRAGVPPEVSDQFSRQEQLSTFSEQQLAIRNIELRERVAKDPGNPYLLHELGTVCYQQGLTKEAIGLWTLANKKEPNLAPPQVMAAVQEVFRLLAKGKKAEAEKQLAAAEKQFAKDPFFQLMKAEQSMRSQNFTAAEQAYLEAYKLGPKLYVTALNLGRFYEFRQRDPAQINKPYQAALQLAPEKPEVWQYIGTFQYHQKQPAKALEAFRRVHKLAPDSPVPERRLGDLNLAAGDVSGAEKWYREALRTKLAPEEELLVHAALGDVLLRLGQLKEARKEIEAVLGKKEVPALVFALATIDETEGQSKLAEKGYRRVIELLPDNPLAPNNLAMLLLKTDGSGAEALALAQQARKVIPNNRIIEGTYGCALVQSGSVQEGVAILESVIKSGNDGDAWTHYFLAKGLIHLNRRDEAKEQLGKALATQPDFPRKEEVVRLLGGTP